VLHKFVLLLIPYFYFEWFISPCCALLVKPGGMDLIVSDVAISNYLANVKKN